MKPESNLAILSTVFAFVLTLAIFGASHVTNPILQMEAHTIQTSMLILTVLTITLAAIVNVARKKI